MLFREAMHRNQTQEQRKHFYPYSAGPEKCSSVAQQLAHRGWHPVSRREELLMEEGDGVGDRRAEGSPAAADSGQAAMPLTPDARSRGSGFWLDLEAGSHLGKSATRSSCVGALLYS